MRTGTGVILLVGLSVAFGAARPFFPQGISWTGKWPTSTTSAEEAYRMMAQPGDPPFMSLQDVIDIQQQKSATLIDARSSEEFAQGRLPGSRSLPYYEMETMQEIALEGLEDASPLVVYCEGVGCELSFFLGRDLQAMGFKDIHIFYGGYPEWKDAGLPIEK